MKLETGLDNIHQIIVHKKLVQKNILIVLYRS